MIQEETACTQTHTLRAHTRHADMPLPRDLPGGHLLSEGSPYRWHPSEPPPGAGRPARAHSGLPAVLMCPDRPWDTPAAFQQAPAKTAFQKRFNRHSFHMYVQLGLFPTKGN